ncbi:MAG TPA: hypothetical protein VGQ52_03940 [Gemmatimonadaceae bacterium]|nr:hypothetical protein [Gemmatimonadaceae bacterium]
MAAATALADLRQRLADKAVTVLAPGKSLPEAGGSAERIPTGSRTLDRALATGGIPRGRLTELHGPLGGGSTTLVRAIAIQAVKAKRWVAYIDAERTLAPRDWAALGKSGRFWTIRPPSPDKAAWCADVLLRSGAFALVVLDSAPPLTRAVAIRLERLARDRNAALLVLSEGEAERNGRVLGATARIRCERIAQTSDLRPQTYRSDLRPQISDLSLVRSSASAKSALQITVEKGGAHGRPHVLEIAYATPLARRLCAHPEVPDRRGVAKRNRRGEIVDPTVVRTGAHGSSSAIAAHNATLPYKRRCAETPRGWLERSAEEEAVLGRGADSAGRGAARARGNGGGRTLTDPRRHDPYGGKSPLRRVDRSSVG